MSPRNTDLLRVEDGWASKPVFMSCLGLVSAPSLTGVTGAALLSALGGPLAYGDTGPLNPNQRAQHAFAIRRDAAMLQRDRDGMTSIDNGDEQLYPTRFGRPQQSAAAQLHRRGGSECLQPVPEGIASGVGSDFEAIPWAARSSSPTRKLPTATAWKERTTTPSRRLPRPRSAARNRQAR